MKKVFIDILKTGTCLWMFIWLYIWLDTCIVILLFVLCGISEFKPEFEFESACILWNLMPPSHCREFCLRTNTNWHSLRIAQHRIDSNYFVLVRCHFRISRRPIRMFWNVQNIRIGPTNRSLFVLRRIASPNVVSIRVGSYWFVSHRCTFVSIRCTFALGFAPCLLRLSTLQYDAQRSHCRIGSHMFALVRVSSY